MAAKLTNNTSNTFSDGRSQKKRPSVAGKKVAQGSRISATASSKTGTPRLDRSKLPSKKQKSRPSVAASKVFEKSERPAKDEALAGFGEDSKTEEPTDLEHPMKVKSAFTGKGNSRLGADGQDANRQESSFQKASSQKAGNQESGYQKASHREADYQQIDISEVAGQGADLKDAGHQKVDKQETSPTAKSKPSKRAGISRRFLIGSLVVILLLAIGTGLLAWNQWFRFDDTADIQGTWAIDGTTQTITITDTDIVMTADVSYPYTLDTFQKTISFSFKQYSGSGSYAFSPERTELYITETDADSGEEVSTKLVKQ